MSTVYEQLSQAANLFNAPTDAHTIESNIHHALDYYPKLNDPIQAGMLATFAVYLGRYVSNNDAPALRDGLRRMIVAGLPGETEANNTISKLMSQARPNRLADPKFDKLNVRYMQKLIGIVGLCQLTASLCSKRIAAMLLLDQASTSTWTTFANTVGFVPYDELLKLRMAFAQHLFINVTDVTEDLLLSQSSLWVASPLDPNAKPITATLQPPQPAFAATASVSPSVSTTTGVSAMNAATTTTVASTIAPQTASIINAVLGSAGLSTDIDTLLADSAALTITNKAIQSMTDELWASKRHADEIQQQLDIERRKAATAMPSTITLTSQSATIPDGTMQMIDASSVFPQLGKLKLPVPSFQWQGDHPDVPKVNDAYIFRKGMLLSVLRNLANGDNAWLQGHTGSGKTTFIEQVAARLGWPVARVAYDSNVDRAELVGRMQLIPDGKGGTESKWLPGILERAISGGYILLCDEMDAGHPNALYTLQPLLEGKGLTLLEDGGRMVVRHPFSRIVATGNTTGNGDPSGLYPACRILSAATLDRFQDFVQVPYLTEAEETNLLKSQAPSLKASVIETIVKFGSELRKAFVSGETPISFSPRRSVAFARHVEDLTGYGLKDEKLCMSMAFRSKLYDAAPEEHRQRLLEIGRAKIAGLDIEAALMDEAN